jgi:hypothetical protein
MARFHATPEGNIPYTAEEEVQRDDEEAQWEFEKAELAKTQYQRNRAKEYPSINDYIDGVVKNDQAQIQAYIDACLAVKLKFPKPTE